MKLAAVVLLIGIFAKDLSGLNGASTSAMDVIIVHLPDGSFVSSPFYIQFDKSVVEKSRTNMIRMKVNGRPGSVNMELDKYGRASFVRETAINEDVVFDVQSDNELIHMTSEQIESLDLLYGMNKIIFYAGNDAKCKCNVFLWKHTDRVIVAEIDGVIEKPESLTTKYLPFVGNDRIQPNVAKLFKRIERNGYKFLYLSSRSITKFEETRNLLRNIQQDGDWIPYGPVILDPTSVFSDSLYENLVSRFDFKARCLNDIEALFPVIPFHSAFGRTESSVIGSFISDFDLYDRAGIRNSLIFTVASNGKVTRGYNRYPDTSYANLIDRIDDYFPSLIEGELPPKYSEM